MMVSGLAMAFVGGVFWAREFWRDRQKAHVESVVSELVARRVAADQDISYYPKFQFRLPSGTIKEAVGKDGDNPAPFNVGDAVRLVYEPGNPADVTVASTWAVYKVAILLGVFGIGGFDLGVVTWWWGRHRAIKRGGKPGSDRQRKQFAALFGQSGGYRSGDPR